MGGEGGEGGEDRPGKYAGTGDLRFEGEVKTPFATEEDVDSMKDMLVDAKPEQVFNVADAWMAVHDRLASGGGSIKGDLDRAVEQALEHWAGEAADEFAKRARKLSKQIADCATYAGYVSVAMRNAGESLNQIKPQIDALGKPGGLRAMNTLGGGISGGGGGSWSAGIRGAPGSQGTHAGQESPDDRGGLLSGGRSTQLKAAALMEFLAMTYSSQTKTMKSWRRPVRAESRDPESYPGHPGGVAPVPADGAPGASRSGNAAGRGARQPLRSGAADNSGAGTSTSGRSASGASSSGTSSSGTSAAGTRVAGISGGTPTGPGPRSGGTSPTAPAGGVSGGREPTTGTDSSPAATGGVRGGVRGGPGSAGPATGNRGLTGKGTGAGRGTAGSGGRDAGAGRSAGAGVGKGGTPDHRQQVKGIAQQGGHRLHFSRGGTRAGDRDGNGNGNGVMGDGVADGGLRPTKYDRNPGARKDRFDEGEET